MTGSGWNCSLRNAQFQQRSGPGNCQRIQYKQAIKGLQSNDIVHKGLQRFWESGGTDVRGISPNWANHASAALVHLYKATNLSDILGGYGRQRKVKQLSGHRNRYSMELNANWRLTFHCDDPDTGVVTRVDLEDLHRPGGARRRK